MITAPYPAVAATRHFIDLSLAPVGCQGWQIEEHQKAVDGINVIVWEPARVELYVDDTQKNGVIDGFMLRKRLRGKPALNANVLDFLLSNPQLIPEDWRKDERGTPRRIFFSGTTYCRPNDDLYVRYLCWADEKWGWGVHWLGVSRRDNEPAALWHIE
jgi:hypothetical protein